MASPAVVGATESARTAALHYVTDQQPGLRRRRAGAGFRYMDADGKRVCNPAALARIRALAIPPAWTDVWICPRADGHLQATGRDARGRKQYRYHPKWHEVRDATKYDRLAHFGRALPRIRRRVARDLRRPGIPREKVLAILVRLLDSTRLRVGNAEYARHNGSYGLTTLKDRHVEVSGGEIRFTFRGKSGIAHNVSFSDRRLARLVRQCQDLAGQELFQYLDECGRPQPIDSADVNEYLRAIAGDDFTAKDFRTWAGTLLAMVTLSRLDRPESARGRSAALRQGIERVARTLGNTTAVCRKYYVHPLIVEVWEAGTLAGLVDSGRRGPRGLKALERALLLFLEGAGATAGGRQQRRVSRQRSTRRASRRRAA